MLRGVRHRGGRATGSVLRVGPQLAPLTAGGT